MKLELVAEPNAQFSSEDKRRIDCDVKMDGVLLRFTASIDDAEPHGRALYAALMLTPEKIAEFEAAKVNDTFHAR